MGQIYLLTFNGKKSYVGRTTGTMKSRFRLHRYNAIHLRGDAAIYHAWRKYGEPVAELLEEVEDEFLNKREMYWIKKMGTLAPGGYNMTTGGEISPMLFPHIVEKIAAKKRGSRHTEETKAKMRAAHEGRASPNKGKRFSKSWRAAMAKAQTGRTHSPETKVKMAAARAAYWAARRAA